MPGLAPGMAEARAMAASKWTAQQIPSQAGKTALVTGANSGIGYQAVLELARHGAHVLLGCRNAAKGKAALDRLQIDRVGGAEIADGTTNGLACRCKLHTLFGHPFRNANPGFKCGRHRTEVLGQTHGQGTIVEETA